MPRFQPRIRKQKARRRAEGEAPRPQNGDQNQLEILPEVQKANQARRASLTGQLQAEKPKFSRKKQKRLDKYIENKLKKEESLELLKKLAANQVDTSLLHSSRRLGAGQGTKHDALVQRLKEERAGVRPVEPESSDSEGNLSVSESDGSEWSGIHTDEEPDDGSAANGSVPSGTKQPVGSGLKRPLELDASGKPIITKRKRLNSQVAITPFNDEEPSSAAWGEASESDSESISALSDSLEDGNDTGSSSESDDEDGAEDEILTAALFAVNNKERSEAAELAVARRAKAKIMMEDWQNEAQGLRPELSNIDALKSLPQPLRPPKPRQLEEDPLPDSLHIADPNAQRKAYFVSVERPQAIQDSRIKLTIIAEEQKIMEAIHNHSVVIVCGATGSGKTTQVPQFLYESGYGLPDSPTPGMIGVTQPRRVAAVAMAKRVGEELGSASEKVSYQIRFDSTVDKNTAIKFMTDGILVREVADDFSLSKYSAVVIDEAHERSVNTDILIGMVSRIVDLRLDMNAKDPKVTPLKLIIMSATLRTDDFAMNKTLFRRELPPLVEAEGRQYGVVEHFARRTQRDYLDQTYQKITRGHRKLPPGAMLVFLTGQNEIATLSKRLKRAFGSSSNRDAEHKVRVSGKDLPLELDDLELGEDRIDDYSRGADDEDDEDETGEYEDEGFDLEDHEPSSTRALILPLYSQLPTKEQLRVFEPPPANTRLIILATNVAETSITIPGIRYVFDCGRAKQKKYNPDTGVYNFEIGWISKANAKQRLGRAGRTGPGHCYRLYSSAVYEAFPDDSSPEILSTPIESVVLQLKSMDLQHVINFPFPTPPDRSKIAQAERLLGYLGALDQQSKITSVGRVLSLYPVSPRYAKMLAIGHQHECIYLTTALVAALATPELFIPEAALDLKDDTAPDTLYDQAARLADDARAERRRAYNGAHSQFASIDSTADALKLLSAFCAYLWTHRAESHEQPEEFCARTFLQPKRLAEATQLYRQLLSIVALHHPGSCDPRQSTAIRPPSAKQAAALKQFVAAGFLDQVAIRADLAPTPTTTAPRSRRPTDVPYLTLFPSHDASRHANTGTTDLDLAVYIHPSSVLARRKASELPPFIIYSALQQGSPRSIAADGTPILGRTRLLPLVPVTGNQLRELARGTPLLEMGKPMGKIETLEPVAGKNGRMRDRRAVWVVPSLVGQAGDKGGARREWPLPAVKVVQVRDKGGGWGEEEK